MTTRPTKNPAILVSSKENNCQQVSTDLSYNFKRSPNPIDPTKFQSNDSSLSQSSPLKSSNNAWSVPADLIDKINELNSLKDLHRPLPSIPQLPTGFAGDNTLKFQTQINTEGSQDLNSPTSMSPSTQLRVLVPKLRQDKMVTNTQPEGYSSNEEWVPPDSFQSKRIDTITANLSQRVISSRNDLVSLVTANIEPRRSEVTYSYVPTNLHQNKITSAELPNQQSPWFVPKEEGLSPSKLQSSINPLLTSYQDKQTSSPVLRNVAPNEFLARSSREYLQTRNEQTNISKQPEILSPSKVYAGIPSANPDRGGMTRDKSAPNLRHSPDKFGTPVRRSTAAGRRSVTGSLSPMGVRKFQSLANKSLFRMSSRESLDASSRFSMNPNMTSSVLRGTPGRYGDVTNTPGRVSVTQLDTTEVRSFPRLGGVHASQATIAQASNTVPITQKPGTPTANNNSSLSPILPNQQSDADTPLTHLVQDTEGASDISAKEQKITNQSSLGVVRQDSQDMSDRLKVLTFNGGAFFPTQGQAEARPPLILSETTIINRFREFEEDIKPHFETVVENPTASLMLDKPRNAVIKGSFKSKITPFDSIHSYPGAQLYDRTIRNPEEETSYQFRELVEKQLGDKFQLLHALPFVDPFGSKGEFYLVSSAEDQSIMILKVLYRGELGIQESGVVVLLLFKLADSTLSQLIDTKRRSSENFKTSELKSLLHDCVTSLYNLQKERQNLVSLHPDFILHDSDNQAFYVFPVSVPSDYDPTDIETKLVSLRRQSEAQPNLNRQKTAILGHPTYMSPILRESYNKNLQECQHSGYKSCAFSLGLILLEAISLKPVDELNQSKRDLYEAVRQNPLYVTSSIVGKEYLIHCPNILRILLNFEEDERPDFILLYFRLFTDLAVFEDPLHPKFSPPIFDSQIMHQLQMSKKLGSLKVTLSFARGHKYVGQVNEYNGQVIRHGHGSFYNEHGDMIFQGTWEQDFPKEGTFFYSEDYRYEGKWGGFFHDGRGILYYKNKPLYEGAWQSFKYHGKGKLYYESGSVRYEGDFKLSMRHGKGKSYHLNGNVYHDGSYKEDRINGQGSLLWPNGDLKFEGEIICDELDDIYLKGTHYEEDNGTPANIYVGELWNDTYHGEGTLYDSQGTTLADGCWLSGELVPLTTLARFKNNELRRFTSLQKSQRPSQLKINCCFNASNIDHHSQEVELYLDFHSDTNELAVDLSTLELHNMKTVFEIITSNPSFTGVKSLTLSKFIDIKYTEDLKSLINSENFRGLRQLSVAKAGQFNDTLCRTVSETTCRNSLKSLSLVESGSFTEEGIEYLLNATSINLETLRIKNPSSLRDKTIPESLAKFTQFRSLTKLSLVQCHLNPESIKTLFSNGNLLQNIRDLNLSRNQIYNKGCQYIMESNIKLNRLAKLNLKNCGIEVPGVSFLCRAQCLSSVRSLNLSQNPVTNAGCDFIFSAQVTFNLEVLKLKESEIGLQGIKRIGESFASRNLKKLELDFNKGINNECVEYLANSQYLGELEEISLVGASINARSVESLCHSEVLENLRSMKIFGNELGKLVGKDIKKQLKIDKRIEIL